MKMIAQGATGMARPSLNDYGLLFERATKLFDGDEAEGMAFLDAQLERNGVDPKQLNWSWDQFHAICIGISEFERVKPARRKRAAKKEESPVMDLLGGITETESGAFIDEETGEVVAAAPTETTTDDAEQEEARKSLGYDKLEKLIIEDENDLNRRLRERMEIVAASEKLKQTAAEAQKHYAAKLKSWEYLFAAQCEAFYSMNPPKKGRTLQTAFGSLSMRAVPESIALNGETDKDGSLQQGWLHGLGKDLAEKFKRGTQTVYTRDLDAIKDHFMDKIRAYNEAFAKWREAQKQAKDQDLSKQKPEFPELPKWLKYTAKHDKFSINQ